MDQLGPEAFEEDTTNDIDEASEDDESTKPPPKPKEGESKPSRRQNKKKTETLIEVNAARTSIDMHLFNFLDTWQHTDKFAYDFAFTVETLIPKVLALTFKRYPGVLHAVVKVEDTLLRYSKAFGNQLDFLKKKQGWDMCTPIKLSKALAKTIKALTTQHKVQGVRGKPTELKL